ncbi:hypothetical protein BH10BAC2_BH10BAC2_12100 [soil metagenome]
MDYSKRTDQWVTGFLHYVETTESDLMIHFYKKIFFSPNFTHPTILHVSYIPLDDSEELKDIRERMSMVFDKYLLANPV